MREVLGGGEREGGLVTSFFLTWVPAACLPSLCEHL